MRSIVRITAVAAAAACAGLLAPSVASAEVVGEIYVAASVDGNAVTITVTDDVVGYEGRKECSGVLWDGTNPSSLEGTVTLNDTIGSDPNDPYLEFYPESGPYTKTFTDIPDGEWKFDYWCSVYDEAGGRDAMWTTFEGQQFPKNRDTIVLTLPGTEPEDPECSGLACLLPSGSAGSS